MNKMSELQWCRDHKCYHRPEGGISLTGRIVLAGIYRQFKLTTRQAKRYCLAIDGDILFVPQRDEHGEWMIVRYRWQMDGMAIRLEPPDEPTQTSLN
jgi:hypothetical protein